MIAVVSEGGQAHGECKDEVKGDGFLFRIATALQRAPDGKWLSSGNPAGRPLGSRHKIADAIIRDIAAEWERSGAEVLERMARDQPAKFAQLAAGLIPKDILPTQVH